MNKMETLEKRNELIEQLKTTLNTAKMQKRALLAVEDKEFRSIQNQINNIDNQLKNNNKQNQNQIKMNSLFNTLIQASKGEAIEGQNDIKIELRKSGKEVSDNSLVLNVRALTPVGGENVVPTNVMDIATILTEQSIISRAGGHMIAVPSDVVLPVLSRGTLAWEGDGNDVGNDNFAITAKKIVLNRLSGSFPLDKKMTKVYSPTLESAITDSIYRLIDEKVTEKILKNAGTTMNTITAGTTTFERLVAAEGILLSKNVSPSTCIYIYNPTDLQKIKANGKKANEITEPILKDDKIGGYNAFASSFVEASTMLMLDASQMWANLAFVELLLDPYTLSAKGQDRIVINCYADAAIANIDFCVKINLV